VRSRGFTLIELVITVAVIAVLASIAQPLAELSAQRTKEQDLRKALRDIRDALDAYKRAADEGRILRAADESGYPPSLEALVAGVPDAKSPASAKLYFLRRIPRDPFAVSPAAGAAETWGMRSYASAPDRPSPGRDVFDVYSLSARVGLNGVPFREW
jgi:general secretion pathway protein G